MRFETKKEVLEFYGKDGKNVRALERMLQKGMVVYENGWYMTRSEKEKELQSSYKEKYLFLKEYLGKLEGKIEDMIVLYYKWYKNREENENERRRMEWEKEKQVYSLSFFRDTVWKQVWYEPKLNKAIKDEWDVEKKVEQKKEKDTSLYSDDREVGISVADGWVAD